MKCGLSLNHSKDNHISQQLCLHIITVNQHLSVNYKGEYKNMPMCKESLNCKRGRKLREQAFTGDKDYIRRLKKMLMKTNLFKVKENIISINNTNIPIHR